MHKGRPQAPADEDRPVSLDPRDLEDLRRLIAKLGPPAPPAPSEVPADNDRQSFSGRVKELLFQRRKRSEIFGPQMFGEPGWDMLLELYADDGGRRHSQSSLCELSGASRSTAMRWIDYLAERGLIHREEHPTDKRRNFVGLSATGREMLELYLSETGHG